MEIPFSQRDVTLSTAEPGGSAAEQRRSLVAAEKAPADAPDDVAEAVPDDVQEPVDSGSEAAEDDD